MFKIKKILATLLTVVMMASLGSTVFASEAVEPYGAIYHKVFPGSEDFFERSSTIYVKPYGTTLEKAVGEVIFRGWVAYDEVNSHKASK